jgi:hypothetical protein
VQIKNNKVRADVIVLIPHFNNNEKLIQSILSIDEDIQVDVIIVDDGSKNIPDIEVIKSQYKNGSVWMEVLEQNKGIEHALNKGLEVIEKSSYKYIARLDCGDFNKINKYTKQFSYLEQNLDVHLLGTWADMVDEDGAYLYQLKHPIFYKRISNKMFNNSMFIHPTVMFRTEVIKIVGNYPVNYKAAEDYAFFFKIIKHFKAENFPESLLVYEINSNSISSTKRKQQVKNRIKIICDNFYFGIYPVYGLFRNSIIYLMPSSLIKLLKTIIK